MNDRPDIPKLAWRSKALAVTILLLAATRGTAQVPQGLIPQVAVDVSALTFTDAQPTATFTIVNGGAAPVDLWFGLACPVSEPRDAIATIWHNQYACALPWIDGLPQHLALAPQAQQTVTLHVSPAPTLPDGQYPVRIIWGVAFAQVGPQGDTLGVGMMHDQIPIVYTKGPTPPRPSHTQWRAPSPAGDAASIVHHTPAVLVVDDRTRATAFTLTNPGATPLDVWLALDCPWFHVNNVNYPESSQYESGWHERIPTAVFWLSGYPQHLTLAPHEQRTIPLTLVPYPKLPPGNYYARMHYMQTPVLQVGRGGDTTFTTPEGTMDVVYHHAPTPPRLTLQQLQATRGADGTWHGCVAATQPGVGFVTRVHAALDDAHGHPVRMNGQSAAWRLDTTVAVLQAVLHDPMSTATDGERKAPDPICFALPAIAAGQYQLVVTAAELEDIGKQQLVRATASVELP